jgi:hypothetical protein
MIALGWVNNDLKNSGFWVKIQTLEFFKNSSNSAFKVSNIRGIPKLQFKGIKC